MTSSEVEALLKKVKKLVDSFQINETSTLQERLNPLITNKSKFVNSYKLKCNELEKECENISKEIEKVQTEIEILSDYYNSFQTKNNELRKKEYVLNSQTGQLPEDNKIMDESKLKLRLYKKLTCLRFDFNAPKDILSGLVVRVKRSGPHHYPPVTFLMKKSDENVQDRLWENIGKACQPENRENMEVLSSFDRQVSNMAVKIKPLLPRRKGSKTKSPLGENNKK